jgi:hypothetical protein
VQTSINSSGNCQCQFVIQIAPFRDNASTYAPLRIA